MEVILKQSNEVIDILFSIDASYRHLAMMHLLEREVMIFLKLV